MASTYTPNLDLPKHSPSDPFDITLINDMADKLDANAGGQEAELSKRDRVANLLDNSDFRNPVCQRGLTSGTGYAYCLDRWCGVTSSAVVNIVSSGVELPYIGQYNMLGQRVEKGKFAGKTVTFAVSTADGEVVCGNGVFPASGIVEFVMSNKLQLLADCRNAGYDILRIGNMDSTDGKSFVIKWAALYEGAYTADTLPAYVPKGYAVELAECQRYYQIRSTNRNSCKGTAVKCCRKNRHQHNCCKFIFQIIHHNILLLLEF